MNRVVYDSVDPTPSHLAAQEAPCIGEGEQESEESNVYSNSSGVMAGDPRQSDNDQNLSPYYVPKSPEDYTLVFESRFESGNLRRAI